MRFYTVDQLGPKRAKTPEGFLVCYDTPIARTGEMIYGPNECPIEPGPDGRVHIIRTPEEVFRPETIASFEGKPVTDGHPDEDVTPLNWRELAMGHASNVRRGAADLDQFLVADLVITDPGLIEEIDDGLREISCGYDADWFDDPERPGWGYQKNIIGNHHALVVDGRCGARCSIGDRKSNGKDRSMSKRKHSIADMLRRAFKAKDEKELEEVVKDAEETMPDVMDGNESGSETHVHVHAGEGGEVGGVARKEFDDHVRDNAAEHQKFDERLKALEGTKNGEHATDEERRTEEEMKGEFEEEAPAGTGDKARTAHDSVYFEDSFRDTIAGAEVLAPGIGIPVFDSKLAPKSSLDVLCRLRRSALDLAYNDPKMREMIEELNGSRALDTRSMPCGRVRGLFRGAVVAKKRLNNGAGIGARAADSSSSNDHFGGISSTGVKTIDDINKQNAEFWKNGGKGA